MIIETIHKLATEDPSAISLVFQKGGIATTYTRDQVWKAIERYSSLAVPHGISLIIRKTSPEAMFSFLGVLHGGGIPAMLSHPSQKEKPKDWCRKIDNIYNLVRPANTITDETYRAYFQDKHVVIKTDADLSHGLQKEERYFVQFSSGSTGFQKGVQITSEKLFNHNAAYLEATKFDKDSRIFSWLPLYHDMGLIAAFLMPMTMGIPIVFMDPFEWVANPSSMLDIIGLYRCTHTWMPNFAFKLMGDRVKATGDLSSLKMIVNCSEPCYAKTMQGFYDKFSSCGLKKEAITTCYAMAENVFAMAHGIGENFDPVTTLIPNVKAKVDSDGQILIKSPFAINSYIGSVLSYTDENGWYATGDLGTIEGDKIRILGRKKDLIISDGRNIYPNDVETSINELPEVHAGRCVVLGEYSEARGSETIYVLAEAKEDTAIGRAAAKKAISERMNEFQISPAIYIVPSLWLKKTSSGKISRTFNLEKLKDHNNRISLITNAAYDVMKQFNKSETIGPDTQLLSSGIFSSLEMMALTLEIEAATGVGMGGAYSMYGDKNETPRELAFFIEKKIGDNRCLNSE